MNFSYEFRAAIRGFHVYRNIWQPYEDEKLRCDFEPDNMFDMFSIKVLGGTGIVGHLPREISRPTKFLIDRGATISAKVCSINIRRSPLFQGGLEIPCLVNVSLPKTVKGRLLKDRYRTMVTELYVEPENENIVGTVGNETEHVENIAPPPRKKQKVKDAGKNKKHSTSTSILSFLKKI